MGYLLVVVILVLSSFSYFSLAKTEKSTLKVSTSAVTDVEAARRLDIALKNLKDNPKQEMALDNFRKALEAFQRSVGNNGGFKAAISMTYEELSAAAGGIAVTQVPGEKIQTAAWKIQFPTWSYTTKYYHEAEYMGTLPGASQPKYVAPIGGSAPAK